MNRGATLQPVSSSPPPKPENRIFAFGSYEASLRSGELRKSGIRLKVQEKPFQVLTMLLESRGELVTREEMRQRLWPSDTFVDFDHGLNTAVNKLRDVLNDSAANPRYIETLPKRGYRFLAEVREITPAAGLSAARDAQQAPAISSAPPSPLTLGLPLQSHDASREAPSAQRESESDLPRASRGLTRWLLVAIQLGYLATYIVPLQRVGTNHELEPELGASLHFWIVVAMAVIAAIGIPSRLYLLFSVGFDYHLLAQNFRRIFPALFVIDEIWALSGLLLFFQYGLAAALLGTIILVYLPFAQRTLVWMAYGKGD